MRDSREGPRRFGKVAGALLVAALLFNEFTLAFFFSPDGRITGDSVWFIRAVNAALLVALLAVVRLRPPIGTSISDRLHRLSRAAATAVGMSAVVSLLICIEAGFYAWNTLRARYTPQPAVSYSAPLGEYGVTSRAVKTIGDRTLYDVTYRRDERGARVTPDSAVYAPRDLVFFGGSFTFGQGVEDDETLPNAVARLTSDWRVLNFGYPGQGPSHILERLERGDGFGAVAEEAHAIYVFIPHHVRRVNGSMRVSTAWGGDFPSYALSADGSVVYRGTMAEARPRLQRAYGWLAREPVLKSLGLDWPIRPSERGYDLTARVIAASRDRWVGASGARRFTVVLFPRPPEYRAVIRAMASRLDAAGVPYLDYSTRFDGRAGLYISSDTHPTPEAYALVAAWLSEDLALSDTIVAANPR